MSAAPKPAARSSARTFPFRSFVAVLRLRLQVDVRQHAGAQAVAGRQQRAALGGRHSVQAPAQPRMERRVAVGLEKERIQKGLAELAVSGPRVAGLVGGERAEVDERRADAVPLDVERGGVLQRHLLVERRQREVELQEGRVPQHAEGPLVGVRHDRDAGMLQHRRPRRGQRREIFPAGHLPRADEAALPAHPTVEAGVRQPPPVGQGGLGEGAEHRALVVEYPGVGVAEGSGLEAWRAARRHRWCACRARPSSARSAPQGDASTASSPRRPPRSRREGPAAACCRCPGPGRPRPAVRSRGGRARRPSRRRVCLSFA